MTLDTDTTSNVIPFPSRTRACTRTSPTAVQEAPPATDREVLVACLEEQLANGERALLVLASAMKQQRELLDELKAAEGWTCRRARAAPGLFGDAALYDTHAVQVVEREG